MSLYVIADTHLSLSEKTNKPMEVFGRRWCGYVEKLSANWLALVKPSDTVVIPGDISWAMTLEEARADFAFLDKLPGTKIIGKGNHDFWWTTATKINAFFEENGFSTFKLLYNNAILTDTCIVAGTRGWFYDKSVQNTVGKVDFDKIINRENIRLKISLDEAAALSEKYSLPVAVFLHFPPVWKDFVNEETISLLHRYGVKRCFFGHMHSAYSEPRDFDFEGITMTLVSSDYLNFAPLPVKFM